MSQREKLKVKYSKLLLLEPAEIEISTAQESFLKQAMEIVNKHMTIHLSMQHNFVRK